jgi:hypothetical protein
MALKLKPSEAELREIVRELHSEKSKAQKMAQPLWGQRALMLQKRHSKLW